MIDNWYVTQSGLVVKDLDGEEECTEIGEFKNTIQKCIDIMNEYNFCITLGVNVIGTILRAQNCIDITKIKLPFDFIMITLKTDSRLPSLMTFALMYSNKQEEIIRIASDLGINLTHEKIDVYSKLYPSSWINFYGDEILMQFNDTDIYFMINNQHMCVYINSHEYEYDGDVVTITDPVDYNEFMNEFLPMNQIRGLNVKKGF